MLFVLFYFSEIRTDFCAGFAQDNVETVLHALDLGHQVGVTGRVAFNHILNHDRFIGKYFHAAFHINAAFSPQLHALIRRYLYRIIYEPDHFPFSNKSRPTARKERKIGKICRTNRASDKREIQINVHQ